MRFQPSILLLSAVFLLVQPAIAQSWGQLKSQAMEAQSSKKYAEAADFWTKALAVCDNKSGPRYIQSMSGLAQTYADQEKYADADECYKRIVELAKTGTVSEESKSALIDYVAVLRKQKRDNEAADLEAKYSLQAKQPEKAPETNIAKVDPKAEREKELKNWQSIMNAASKESAQKHFPQAEQLYKQALAASAKQERLSNESLAKLIQLYSSWNKFALAEPFCQQSLAITRKISGTESQEYAHALMGHGQLLRKLNRKPEAIADEGKAERILAKLATDSAAGRDRLLNSSKEKQTIPQARATVHW